MNARIVGGKKVAKNLKRHGKRVEDLTGAALKSGALLIENEASDNVPVRTGNLKRSITNKDSESQGRQVIEIGTDVDYASAVEGRTPWLRPAFESKKDEAIKEVEDALDELIKKWNR